MRKGEAKEDLEGLQTMRTLARNMAFLMKSIALGKEKYGLPEQEERDSYKFCPIRESSSERYRGFEIIWNCMEESMEFDESLQQYIYQYENFDFFLG